MSSSWPVSVVAVPPATCGAVLWRMQGVQRVTILVKATFQLAHEKRAEIISPLEIVRDDQMRPGSGSLERPAETAPYLPGVGILLQGHACAPPGRTATAVTVRLALYRDRWILSKLLHVYGDRFRDAPNPRPFQSIPLVYERGYGGASVPANPVGVGATGSLLPNVVDATDPLRPAGFGPIARSWAPRRSLLASGREPDASSPELDPSFDFRWFHAAPADQQIDFLRGDEWISLEGLHPQLPWIRCGLPSARGIGRLHRLGAQGPDRGQAVDLVADTLMLDADHLLCSVLWRGHFVCGPNDVPAKLVVMGGVEMPGRPVVWPAPDAFCAVTQDVPRAELVDDDRTAEIRLTDLVAKKRPVVPFVPGEPGKTSGPAPAGLPGAPWSPGPVQPVPRPADNLAVTATSVFDPMAEQPPVHTVEVTSPFASWKAGLPFPARASTVTSTAVRADQPAGGVPFALPFAQSPGSDVAQEPELLDEPEELLDVEPELDIEPEPPSPVPSVQAPPSARVPPSVQAPPSAKAPGPAPDPPAPAAVPVSTRMSPQPEVKGVRATVIARLKTGEPLHDLELAGAELDGVDFSAVSLERRNLAGATLTRCNFTRARLSGADLSGADLTEAILTEADLRDADLGRATLDRARLDRAVLAEANLSSVKAQGASFEGASLQGADVRKARLSQANLGGTNLSGIVGGGVDFSRSTLVAADLRAASLRAAKLREANLARASVDGADLRDADLTRANVYGVNLGSAKTAGAILRDLVEIPPAEKS